VEKGGQRRESQLSFPANRKKKKRREGAIPIRAGRSREKKEGEMIQRRKERILRAVLDSSARSRTLKGKERREREKKKN